MVDRQKPSADLIFYGGLRGRMWVFSKLSTIITVAYGSYPPQIGIRDVFICGGVNFEVANLSIHSHFLLLCTALRAATGMLSLGQ